jgi:hypothetical protein
MAAADAIVSFLRHCRRSNQREEIRKRIKESKLGRVKPNYAKFLNLSGKFL